MIDYSVTITRPQLFKILKQLTLVDAKEAVHLLNNKIEQLESTQRPASPQTLLASLPFTIRTLNVFKQHRLLTIYDLTSIGLKRLRSQKGIGQKTLQEIREVAGVNFES